ncbi:YaaC family protein [Streptomyces europaeiscabiei]|uniref:YaaC family protein n=1 Tax=Streptomyces europaeiscabiei TaxID=146819 RepID=UPI0038D422F5
MPASPQAGHGGGRDRRLLRHESPAYRFIADRFLRPSSEPAKVPPTPLVSRWLLLYSFSMLTRYQPRKWSEALDV